MDLANPNGAKADRGTLSASIVIRAYNEEAHIGRLMEGLRAQRVQPLEVILVDSGSTDSTVTIAQHYGARIVRIAKEDFTFGRALNVGCEAANGDILVFVSAHVYPTHDTWLGDMLQPFEDERVVLSYGGQVGGDTNKYSEHRLFAQWFPQEAALPQKGYFCNNANSAVRRSVWETHNYDEALTGLEDLDWAKRAQADGGWLAYVPKASIVHIHEETWAQVRNRYRREAIALRNIDSAAHFSFTDFVGLFTANVTSDFRVALKHKMFLKEWRSIVLFRFNQFYGALQGHRDPPELSRELKRRFYYPTSETHNLPDRAPNDEAEGRIDYANLSAGKLEQ
ncbi:MAG: glycosyltransferase family A protein [Pseudomonadota bacterium]